MIFVRLQEKHKRDAPIGASLWVVTNIGVVEYLSAVTLFYGEIKDRP